jgi:hypothetical protein
LHIFKGKFDYSNSLTLENKILIVASIFLSDGILGATDVGLQNILKDCTYMGLIASHNR